jgi:hypothetical protein
MPYPILKFLIVFVGSLLLTNSIAAVHPNSNGCAANQDSLSHLRSNSKSTGYNAIIRYEDGFMAVGSEGRIDRISVSGKNVKSEKVVGENFKCLLSDNQRIVVAGDHGTLMISYDNGPFGRVNCNTAKNINTLTLFKGKIVAGTDDGEILSGNGKDFSKIFPAVKGNIVSLSARISECFGVTDKGEIIHSSDGINWDVFDFNTVYAGFYKPCIFRKILATETNIAVAGVKDDGSAVLMFSNKGNVWAERTLNYSDDRGLQDYLTDTPNDIFYDYTRDLFYLACDKGMIMKIPSCSHCNQLARLSSEKLAGVSGDGNVLMVVGENFYLKTLDPE